MEGNHSIYRLLFIQHLLVPDRPGCISIQIPSSRISSDYVPMVMSKSMSDFIGSRSLAVDNHRKRWQILEVTIDH